MNLNNIGKEELELLSYKDIAYLILKESKEPLSTPTIFRKICDLLEYTDKEYTDKIGDFYTTMTIDKRFILLESAEWDLRERRSISLLASEEDDDVEDDLEDEIIEDIEDDQDIEEDDYGDGDVDDTDDEDTDDDDLADLSIVTEDDLEDD